ncbi:hypothetical protein [Sporosarcina sp. UB5]|uniref:hypothetical protein n=1 Tax=Sporosarcina sp. UB5 TaxID=3047463 RepID=UPI003D7A7DBD
MINDMQKWFEKIGGKVNTSFFIASCILLLTGCQHLQQSKFEKNGPYEKNFEIIGSEKDALIGKVNPAIFNTVNRSNENAKNLERVVLTKKGTKVTLQPGRYTISGYPVGNIFIYDENDDLVTREIVGYVGGVNSLTVDIEETYTVFADGGYDNVSFAPMPTALFTELSAGIWEVGLDIESGEYIVTSPSGLGYLEIHEREKEPLLFEIIGGDPIRSESRVQLKDGQKLRIKHLSVVNFEPLE